MKFKINDKEYNVEVVRKISNKNTYIRVKDDLTIYVTTNTFVSNYEIEKILNNSVKSIMRMIEIKEKEKIYNNSFYYLGHKYNIVYTENKNISFDDDNVYLNKNFDIDKWYKKQALKIFKERLDYNYQKFSVSIPYPSLVVRKMKTRWGVCNTRDIKVTLNLELIKKDIICLDYVINHELSHLIHPNHSKSFWALVKTNFPEYNKVRKMLKNYDDYDEV